MADSQEAINQMLKTSIDIGLCKYRPVDGNKTVAFKWSHSELGFMGKVQAGDKGAVDDSPWRARLFERERCRTEEFGAGRESRLRLGYD